MKKLISILTTILFFQGSFSQIIYEYSDFATAGETFINEIKTYEPDDGILLSSFDEDWDFTQFEPDSIDSIRFVLPSETQYSDSFPNANLAMIRGEGTILFLNSSNANVQLVGLAADYVDLGMPFSYPVTDSFMIAQFPVTYGNEFSNQSFFSYTSTFEDLGIDPDSLELPVPPDSVRITISISDESEIDNFGTLNLANGEHETIKEKRIEIININLEVLAFTVWFPIPGFPMIETTHSYRWYAKNNGYPIAEVYADINDNVFLVSYLKTIPLLANTLNKASTNVFPNPVEDILIIEIPENKQTYKVQVYDMTGKVQFEEKSNKNLIEIDVSRLSHGIYVYNIYDINNQTIGEGKFIKHK